MQWSSPVQVITSSFGQASLMKVKRRGWRGAAKAVLRRLETLASNRDRDLPSASHLETESDGMAAISSELDWDANVQEVMLAFRQRLRRPSLAKVRRRSADEREASGRPRGSPEAKGPVGDAAIAS